MSSLKKKKFSNSEGSKKTKIVIIGGVVAALIISGVVGYYFIIKSNGDNPTLAMSTSVQTEIKTVYIAAKDMEAGSIVSVEDFNPSQVDINTPLPADVVTDIEEISNQRLKNDVKANQHLQRGALIHKNAWYEKGDRFIEHAFVDGAIPVTISRDKLVGTLVDIMLFRKDGEDDVVISKAPITAESSNILGFNLNEIEAEYLKEAATEGTFYIKAYLDESQEASVVTYIPAYAKGRMGQLD